MISSLLIVWVLALILALHRHLKFSSYSHALNVNYVPSGSDPHLQPPLNNQFIQQPTIHPTMQQPAIQQPVTQPATKQPVTPQLATKQQTTQQPAHLP